MFTSWALSINLPSSAQRKVLLPSLSPLELLSLGLGVCSKKHRKIYSSLFVNFCNPNFNFLSDLNYVIWIFDKLRRHFGNMNHSFFSGQNFNKCSERKNSFYFAFENFATPTSLANPFTHSTAFLTASSESVPEIATVPSSSTSTCAPVVCNNIFNNFSSRPDYFSDFFNRNFNHFNLRRVLWNRVSLGSGKVVIIISRIFSLATFALSKIALICLL